MKKTFIIAGSIAVVGLCLLGLFIFRLTFIPECMWTGRIVTWEDRNGDGIWNNGETPLAGVTVRIEDKQRALTQTTNDESIVDMAFRYGCNLSELDGFRLGVKAPPGYKQTTPSEMQVPIGKSSDQLILFGLKKDD